MGLELRKEVWTEDRDLDSNLYVIAESKFLNEVTQSISEKRQISGEV